MNHRIAECAFRAVVVKRDPRVVEEDKQMLTVLHIPFLQAEGYLRVYLHAQQCVAGSLDSIDLLLKQLCGQRVPILDKSLGAKQKLLHPVGKGTAFRIDGVLHIAQLMGMANLSSPTTKRLMGVSALAMRVGH